MASKKIEYRASLIQQAVFKTIEKLEKHINKPVTEEEYIHRIRVDIKRLRGWLRVLRIRDGELDWKIIDQHLHDIAGSLGGSRDAEVINETLQLLSDHIGNDHDQAVFDHLKEKIYVEISPAVIDWKKIKPELTEQLQIYKKDYVSFKNMAAVKRGIRRLYKKTLGLGNQAFSSNGVFEDLHKLRRWVKYLNYQLNFVRKAYPDCLEDFKKEISLLGSDLGEIHDLVMLKERIKNDVDLQNTNELIDKTTEYLLNKSRQSYHYLFNLSPEKFIQLIE